MRGGRVTTITQADKIDALVRALLDVEWAWRDPRGDETEAMCPYCFATESEGHYPPCTIDVALRLAGAR